MNPNDLELMINYIAIESVKNEASLKEFKRIGVDINDWPKGKTKDLMIEFMATIEVCGFLAAQGAHGREIVKLTHNKYSMEDLRINYFPQIITYKANTLAFRILEYPLDIDRLVNEYRNNRKTSVVLKNIYDHYDGVVERHINKCKEGDSRVIIPSFEKLSKAINGFNSEMITIISAKSGYGKTKLALNLSDSAKEIMPTIYYNMEMPFDQFLSLYIHKNSNISNDDWFDGSFIVKNNLDLILENKKENYKRLKISDGYNISLEELKSSIFLECENEPHFIIIDYDQKVRMPGRKQEWEEILELVTELEGLAKVTHSHIILLAQANDHGNVKASSRALQPASNLLNFYKDDEGRDVIRSLKTRHARNFILEVDYDPARSKIIEKDFLRPEIKITNTNKFSDIYK